MENSVESLSGSSNSAVPAAAPRPVAAPRKSSAKSLDLTNKPKTTPKPKPPISAKPKIPPLKPSGGSESTVSASQTTRPKSIRITDDEIHGKVASELASILGRPRSSSKGLLSPTSYSASDGPGTDNEDSITPSPSQQVSPKSAPPKPLPRVRLSQAGADAVSPEATDTSEISSPVVQAAMLSPSPAAPSSHDSQGQSPKKPKPARPPPPSVKRPPPPVVKPTFKPALPETPAVSVAPGNIVKATPVAQSPSTLPNSEQQQSSTKRRLEITVLGARPMSEVGFRDVKIPPSVTRTNTTSPVGTESSTTSNIHIESQKVPLTPPPHPPLSTDESSSHGAPDTPNSVTSKPRRKPTIIRPSRPATTPSTDSPTLVSKEGPGPIDNLAFSTGDTPPPKSQRVPTLPVSVNVNESKPVSHDSNDSTQPPVNISTGNSRLTGKTDDHLIDQSARATHLVKSQVNSEPEELPADMFYQTSGGHSESAAVGKPSALQRIYGYKKAREEQQPQKYKHRPDCYIDKPNNDSNFWKPGGSETETGRSMTTPNKAPSANGSIFVKCMEKKRSGKCLAKYTFAGETKMDLEFKEGDTIELLEKVDVDWFKGKIGQKEGLFPAAYVEIIEDIAESTIPAKAEDPGAITALVAFDFKGSKPGDLSLKGGQEVIILSKVDSQWLYGEVDGKRGVFPSLYASIADEEIEELPIHKVSPAVAKENGSKDGVVWATALYDFTAENDSELSLKAGDSVKVTASDNEWSTGEKDGRIGLFPTNFVQLNGPQVSSVSH